MEDSISRKAAIDAINALHERPNAWLDYAVDAVMALPSAQPDHSGDVNGKVDLIDRQATIDALNAYEDVVDTASQVFIIRGCKKAITNLPSVQPELCEDAVSRRILLHDLKELITAWEKYPVMAEQIKGVETAIGYVEAIPSVTPKRKTGKWLDAVLPNDNGGLPVEVCDQCNTFFPLAFTGGALKFCPNCGADMRGEPK